MTNHANRSFEALNSRASNDRVGIVSYGGEKRAAFALGKDSERKFLQRQKKSEEGMLARDGDGKGGGREGASEDSESRLPIVRLDVWLCFLSRCRPSDL